LLQYTAHVEPTVAIMDALIRQHGRALQRILCSATASDVIHASSSSSSSKVDEEVERSSIITTTTAKSTPAINIESYLKPGYAHASVNDSDLLVTSGIIQTRVISKDGSSSSSTTTTMTSIAPRVSRTTIHGTLHVPSQRLALEAVRKILNTEPVPQQALIFVDSSRRVDIVIDKLSKMDIIAAPLHGGTTSGNKSDRAQVNRALREGYVGIVVATEMAARGIDAPYLTHCINLDLPTDASHYAHRAGRCGRGGRPGVSISITCTAQEKGVPRRFADELGITMYNVEARNGKLWIVEG
jgi:Lhr-like helicase